MRTVGYGKFPKMPAEAKAEYEAIKENHQTEKIKEIAKKTIKKDRGDIYKERTEQLMTALREKGWSYEEIGSMCGMTKEAVSMTVMRYQRNQEGGSDDA